MTDLQDPYGVDDEQSSSPMRGRGFILSTVIIVVVLLAGAFVITFNIVDNDTDPAPAPTDDTAHPTSAPADPEASVCGLADVKLTGGLVTPPEDVSWALAGKVALPSSEKHGPGETKSGRYCFSRTPEGAVLAAASTYGWQTVDDLRLALEHSVAAGEGHDAAQAILDDVTDGSTEITTGVLQIRGFRLISYNGNSALVDLAAQATVDGQTGFAHQQFELLWERGDWRLRLSLDGAVPRAEAIPDLTGYVPWAGA